MSSCLPGGFHNPVQSNVVTMNVMKKSVKVGVQTIYSMEKFYGRLLIISNKRSLPLQYVFGFELAPLPSSLFDEFGWMRQSSKYSFTSKFIVPYTGNTPVNVQLVDGNEVTVACKLAKDWNCRGSVQ